MSVGFELICFFPTCFIMLSFVASIIITIFMSIQKFFGVASVAAMPWYYVFAPLVGFLGVAIQLIAIVILVLFIAWIFCCIYNWLIKLGDTLIYKDLVIRRTGVIRELKLRRYWGDAAYWFSDYNPDSENTIVGFDTSVRCWEIGDWVSITEENGSKHQRHIIVGYKYPRDPYDMFFLNVIPDPEKKENPDAL